MLSWIFKLVDRIFALVCAIAFSQAPLFIQHYTHHLSGHEAELRHQVEITRQAALQTGKSLEQYIHKFISNGDPDFQHQGEIMQAMVMRWNSSVEALKALQESSLWIRPLAFVQHLDLEIFKSTKETFKMGVPLDLEGALYALVGMLLGFFLFSLLKKLSSINKFFPMRSHFR